MLKTILILPDGTELSSGTVGKDAIFSSSLTEQVNNGQELTIGSTCANMLEATIWNPGGRLTINTGDELILYKEEKDGTRHKAGVFVAETPTRPSENSMKITCYDRVPKLDTDLTQWLLSLSGWPYTLLTFAKMVCEQCGLALINEDIPNRSFPVYAYTKAGTTGRMLMQWLGEICARFCRADADGNIEFSWYRPTENIFSATGKYTGEFEPVVQDLGHYYEGGLTYSDYAVGKIEAVQIQLADSADGYLWPETEQGLNSYVITGNPFLNAVVTDDLKPYLDVILEELQTESAYRPCKITVPAQFNVRAGDTFLVAHPNNPSEFFAVRCMKKTQKGHRDTLECTGSIRRDTTTARHSGGGTVDQTETPTPEELIDILTNGGEIEGIFFRDGQLYINASYIYSGAISSVDGLTKFDLDNGVFRAESEAGVSATLSRATFSLSGGADSFQIIRIPDMGYWITSTDAIRIQSEREIILSASTLNWGGVEAYWADNGDGTYTLMGRK